MKLIFLDVDGVLNNRESMRGCGKDIFRVNRECVRHLNKICVTTGACCVLSSTWRFSWPIAAFQQFLEDHGFCGQVIDSAPRLPNEARGAEIEHYLLQCEQQGYPIESWIILDDDSDMGDLLPFLIQTKTEIGLEEEHVGRAIEMLGPT